MIRSTLTIALVVVICSVPLAAQATRPTGSGDLELRLLGEPLNQQQLRLDRSLSTFLAEAAGNPASQPSGQYIVLLNSAASAGPSTRPADLQLLLPLIENARLQWDIQGIEAIRAFEQADAAGQNTSYMGIGVEAPGAALRSQLSLPEGAGLVVNYIDDKGPSKNIIHMHDVLQKLDDQILINGEQLVSLVRMHKPGDAITLTLLRHASLRTERITLGQRQPEPKDPQSNIDAQVLTDLTAGLTRSELLYATAFAHPITFNDGDVLASLNGHGELLVIDQKTGKTLFNGPIGTRQQWEQVPDPVRNKLNAWRAMIAVHQPPAQH